MKGSNIRLGAAVAIAALIALVVVFAGCAASPPAAEKTYPILGKVIVTADLVRGSKNPVGAVCAGESQYQRGEEVVPRVKILDPKTEQYLTDKEMKSVTFFLKDGTNAAMRYGPHPAAPKEPTDHFWTTGWIVPDNYPTGATGWWVEAVTNDGRTGRYDPPNVASSQLTILEKTATQ